MAITFDEVRKIALALKDVEEGTSYGTPAFRVKGKLFARLREDGESLVVRMGFEERAEMMKAEPEIYYITDHYLHYEWMLVRLKRVHPDAMADLLRMSWRAAADTRGRGPSRSGQRRARR